MRIAYLCKRQYMGHDVIVDRYARLYEQPAQLARRGHAVLGLCLAYRPVAECDEQHGGPSAGLRWVGLSPGRSRLGALTYPRRLLQRLRSFAPDLIIAASDAPHIVLGAWLARRLGVPFAADLYDNFETFGLSRLPGLIRLYRQALRSAVMVSCVSEPLAALVRAEYGATGEVLALPSTVDLQRFRPLDRADCRARFGLPAQARLIGTAGALSREKGIDAVYAAWLRLMAEDPGLHLVLAGPLDAACPPPSGERVHVLGMLAHQDTPALFGALDVAVVYLRDTPYGRYSFPQKALEIAACQVPMAVASVGAMAALFGQAPQSLYTPDDAGDLARCIRAQLQQPVVAHIDIPDWAELAGRMERALQTGLTRQAEKLQ